MASKGIATERRPTFEELAKACFLLPKTGRYIVIEDGFSYSGLLTIPDTAKRASTTGVIIRVGPECDEGWLGQRVVYGAFSGTLIKYKGKPAYRIMNGDEILAAVQSTEELELENVSG